MLFRTVFLYSLILLGISSCSKKEVKFSDLKDVATEEERAVLNENLDDIQERLLRLGSGINIRELDYKITEDLPTGEDPNGVCFYKEGITIHKRLFKYIRLEDRTFIKEYAFDLWKTLLHEIGHCYFNLDHYYSEIFAPEGMVFILPQEDFSEFFTSTTISKKVALDVMNIEISRYTPAYLVYEDLNHLDHRKDLFTLEIINRLKGSEDLLRLFQNTGYKLKAIEELYEEYELKNLCIDPEAFCLAYPDFKDDPRYVKTWIKNEQYDDIQILKRKE
jgi:hypothetical protein